jgi:hypothetical protein
MKRLSIVLLVIVAILFAAWWAFVRAPGPEEVCAHIAAVTKAEVEASGVSLESEAAVIEGIERRCVQHKRDKIQLRGRIKYAEYAKCVMAADTVAAIGKC